MDIDDKKVCLIYQSGNSTTTHQLAKGDLDDPEQIVKDAIKAFAKLPDSEKGDGIAVVKWEEPVCVMTRDDIMSVRQRWMGAYRNKTIQGYLSDTVYTWIRTQQGQQKRMEDQQFARTA